MKILWISHHVPYPPKAGLLLRSYNLIRELSKYHDITLLAVNQRELIAPYFESYEQGTLEAEAKLSEFCANVQFFNLPIDRSVWLRRWCAARSLLSRYPYSINWLNCSELDRALANLDINNTFEMVHVDTIGLMPKLDALKITVPLSLDHHNVESEMMTRRAELETNKLLSWYYRQEGAHLRALEKVYCSRANTNITCSELDNQRFKTIAPAAKFFCIPNGVDITVFRPSRIEPARANFIFIGTLDWYPNIRAVRFIANDLFGRIKAILPDAEVHIIGAKPPADIIAAAESEADLHVHGYVDDINPFLENATAYLCPINDGGGTKLKLLDAFASGKAVIADPIACEGLNVTDGQQALLASSPDEFVAAIMQLVSDPTLRKALETNAREHVENNFSFESIGRNLSAHYDSLFHV